ncbi:alpha/beta hydrolase [Maritimibacter sp. UBA3975]|uniref:alpha/beta hydrolase n=1 Tax=Maritimibacter sp. UBA3975 TaxID=1946833 RepID=UPI000C0A1CBC|nr:alpha/beta hydrolase [Maritimibacter sp. UBA3975]MAM62275.1 hypothetical protein [Maritimibacter sp.]|tara:strand:- start:6517 stop:8256 length:1740 start_codon:yes stop_codon:yes gene_type:complete
MSVFRLILALVLAVSLHLPTRLAAQTTDALAGLQIALADPEALPPEEVIERIDAALIDASLADPRLIFDLQMLKADVLEDLGRRDEAALLYAQLGDFAARERETLERDPVALYETAITLFRDTGDLASAATAVERILGEQRDAGAGADAIADTQDRLAALARETGDTALAEEYAAAAQATRTTPAPSRSVDDDGGYHEVEVFYATDRARGNEAIPAEFYSGQRGTLELGIATVTIPNDHQTAIVESPTIWKLQFGPNPAKHVVLQSVTPVTDGDFWDGMRTRLEDRAADDIFVFVHGFNVAFEKGMRRTAQMAHDMKFPGVPVLYSWPSRGSAFAYVADAATVRVSARRLTHFLDDIVARSGAGTIHLVAHSMGNRALTDALELMALRRDVGPGDAPPFDQVIFAAPDVDAGLFSAMLPTIRPLAERLTLYASDRDFALATSRRLHGRAPRAGQGGDDLLALEDLDSVDMSALGDDMLAHTYYASDSSALADLVTLFYSNAEPARRCGLSPRMPDSAAVPVWTYAADSCADKALVEVLTKIRRGRITSLDLAQQVLADTVLDPALRATLVPVVRRLMSR